MRKKLIEAMARAICEAKGLDWDKQASPFTSASGSDEEQEGFRLDASSALDAALGMLETPSEEMWGGLARQLIMWMDMGNKTPAGLLKHLEQSGRDIPDWLRDEPEMQALNHVPSKGTRAVLVFRAMLATLRSPKI